MPACWTRRRDGYRCAPPILRATSCAPTHPTGSRRYLAQHRFPEVVFPIANLSNRINLICPPWQIKSGHLGCGKIDPTGKSLLIFRNRVKPRNQKYFCFRLTQISSLIRAVPSHKRGGSRSSRTRGGMRWTLAARETSAACWCTAKSCRSDAPMLASSLR